MPTASMFHPATVQLTQRIRQPNQVRSLFSSTIHRPGHDSLRRGILFIIVSVVCLLVGGILTWLGFNDVFGGKASMTGPLLIALAVLLLLFSTRQFTLAKKRNFEAGRIQPIGRGTVAALVIDQDENIGAVTVIVDNGPLDEVDTDSYGSRGVIVDNGPPSYTEATAMPYDIRAPCVRQNGQPSPGSQTPDSEPPPSYDEAIEALVNQNQHRGTNNRQQGIAFVSAAPANQLPIVAGTRAAAAVPHNRTITAVHVTVSTANYIPDNNNSVHVDQHVDLDSLNNNNDRNRNQNRMENG